MINTQKKEVCHSSRCDAAEVPIAAIHAMTTIDFPGKISSVFFTKGCPWRCRYCHNPILRHMQLGDSLSWDNVQTFLEDRTGYIEGIVLSGGEPTIHSTLPSLLEYIRSLGYATALHTNGYYPDMLFLLLKKKLVDYVAMDIKGPPREYDRITGVRKTCNAVSRSVEIILSSGVDYEFRTTWHPLILSEKELVDTIHAVYSAGVKKYYIQRFRSQGVEDSALVQAGNIEVIPEAAVDEARALFDEFDVR